MGLRFRKSFKIAPGVRVNVGKKSVGISAGVKGARVSVNSKGRKTTTVGLPGTGLSYSKSEKIGGSKTKAASTPSSDEPLNTVSRPDLPPAQPQEEKKKSGCFGCLSYLVAFLLIMALFNSCGGDKQDRQDATTNSATTTTASDAQSEQMITALTLDGEVPTEINVGDSYTLTYTIEPSDFLIDDSVAYATTSDSSVLSVTTECCAKPARVEVTLTGKAAGTASYTVHAAEGDAQQTGQITVRDQAAEQAAAQAKAEQEAAEKAAAEQAAAEAAAAEQAAQEQAAAQQQQSEIVYITPSGKRWHRSASCAGSNAIGVSMDQVGSRTPCQKCAA